MHNGKFCKLTVHCEKSNPLLQVCNQQVVNLLFLSSATIRKVYKQLYESNFCRHILKKCMLNILKNYMFSAQSHFIISSLFFLFALVCLSATFLVYLFLLHFP